MEAIVIHLTCLQRVLQSIPLVNTSLIDEDIYLDTMRRNDKVKSLSVLFLFNYLTKAGSRHFIFS